MADFSKLLVPIIVVGSVTSIHAQALTQSDQMLGEAWRKCAAANAISMARGNRSEAADTVVTGALFACQRQEDKFFQAIANKTEPGPTWKGHFYTNIAPSMRDNLRGKLLAIVLKTRADASANPPQSAPSPGPVGPSL